MIKVKRLTKNAVIPTYATSGSSGMDLCAVESVKIKAREYVLVKTGLAIELEEGYEAQIRPRSGLALKSGITVLNTPGTIDADYRGEIGVILLNVSNKDFTVQEGDRIAQMVIQQIVKMPIVLTDSLKESDRGSGGFGSTGK